MLMFIVRLGDFLHLLQLWVSNKIFHLFVQIENDKMIVCIDANGAVMMQQRPVVNIRPLQQIVSEKAAFVGSSDQSEQGGRDVQL